MAVQLRERVIQANGADRVKAAELRLCGSCHFEASGIAGMCGVNSLLLPLTLEGRDCPYHLPRSFAKQPTMPTPPAPASNPTS